MDTKLLAFIAFFWFLSFGGMVHAQQEKVDFSGASQLSPDYDSYMGGKEHYLPDSPFYMAGKVHYLQRESSSSSEEVAPQNEETPASTKEMQAAER